MKIGRNIRSKYVYLAIPVILLIVFIKHNFFDSGGVARDMNVILITIDTLRADHVGIYNLNEKSFTPSIDKLAEEGTFFKHCISQTPLTLPSHTSILSGTYPLYHQVRDNGGFKVPQRLTLMSEIFSKHGYATSAFVGAYVLHSKWGLSRGFDKYFDDFDISQHKNISLSKIEFKAERVLDEASSWIMNKRGKKFFSWIHLYDPHSPYAPPPPFNYKFKNDLYKGEIAYTDSKLGEFLKKLKSEGFLNNTLVIVTSDHGEGRGDHKEENHGFFIYESSVRVPLVIKSPVEFPLKEFKGNVGLVDLMPTILDIVNLPIPASCQGRSMLKELEGSKQKSRPVYTETYYPLYHYGWSELRAIYKDNYKFILAPKPELYDLANDGNELNNLIFKKFNITSDLKKRLKEFTEKYSKNMLSPVKNSKMSTADIKRFRTLGYLSGDVNSANNKNKADPKDKYQIVLKLKESLELLKSGKYMKARNNVKKILNEDPQITDAHVVLGNCYVGIEDFRKALQSFEKALENKPQYNIVMGNILNCYIVLKDYSNGILRGEKFLKIFPDDPTIFMKLGELNFLNGDLSEAEKYFKKSYIKNRFDSKVTERLSEISINTGDLVSAAEYLANLKKIDPGSKVLSFLDVRLKMKQGRSDEAIGLLNKELNENPDNAASLYNLGTLYMKKGKFSKALQLFNKTKTIDPGLKELNMKIAEIYSRKGNHKKAVIFLRKEISNFKNSYHAYYNLAIEYYQLRSYDEAIHAFRKSLDLKPDYEDAVFNLASVYLERGDRSAALKYFKMLLKLNPEDIIARIKVGHLLKGVNNNEALKHFKAAFRIAEKRGDKKMMEKINSWIINLK